MCPKNIRDFDIRKILIIGLSCLGDNLLITPSIKLIKDSFKKADVDIVVGPNSLEFAKDNPWFSQFFIYNKQKGFGNLLKKLRKTNYDLIVDFRNSMFPFLLRGKFKLTFFLKEFMSDKIFTSESERMIQLLEPFFGKPDKLRLYFPVSNAEKEKTDRLLRKLEIRKSDIFVVLNPGANFIPKRWPEEKFAEVGKALSNEYAAKIILIGTEKEKALAGRIKDSIQAEKNVFNFAGKTTLRELASLLQRADVIITNDTGPMHLAAAVQCPVVVMFGPSNPYRYGPVGTVNHIIHSDIDCFPCKFKNTCKRKDFLCMKKINPDIVLNAARLVLDNKEQQLTLFDI